MTETSESISITIDQLTDLTLPLGKALSILELFVPDMSLPEADGAYVVADLIREAERVADDWTTIEANETPGEAS